MLCGPLSQMWIIAIAKRHIKTHANRDATMWPVEAKVGGALVGVVGADTEPLMAVCVHEFLYDRPVRLHGQELGVGVCGVILALGASITLGTVSYGRVVLPSMLPCRDLSTVCCVIAMNDAFVEGAGKCPWSLGLLVDAFICSVMFSGLRTAEVRVSCVSVEGLLLV